MTHWHEEEEEEEEQTKREYCDIFLYSLIFMFGVNGDVAEIDSYSSKSMWREGREKRRKEERGERNIFLWWLGEERNHPFWNKKWCVLCGEYSSLSTTFLSPSNQQKKKRESEEWWILISFHMSFLPSLLLPSYSSSHESITSPHNRKEKRRARLTTQHNIYHIYIYMII